MIFVVLIMGLFNSAHSQVFIPFSFWRCTLPQTNSFDSLNADFAAGTTSNTTVTGASVVLSAGQTTGTFTSRVFNLNGNCPINAYWYSATWKTSLPFGKLLPDFNVSSQSESIADYSGLSSSTFMSGVMGQWHMQETATGTAPGAKDFADSSGTGAHGTIVGGVAQNAVGKIGRAVTFNGTSGYVNFGTPATITGLGNWSVSFWINPTAFTANQQIILYRSDNDAQQGFFITMTSTGQIRFQGVFATADEQSVSSTLLVAGAWTHVLITTDSSITSANTKIYFNGTQVAYTGAVAGSGTRTTAVAQPLYIGKTGPTSAPNTNAFLNASLEEVTFFGRILTAAEILELYRRGINRVKMQFRSCLLSNCADLPAWKGPDGTSATFYTEIYNNSIQSTWLGYVLPPYPEMIFTNFTSSTISNNQYFQYKATLETDNTTYLPDFKYFLIKRP